MKSFLPWEIVMKLRATVIVGMVLVFEGVARSPADDADASARKLLTGTWICQSAVNDGKPLNAEIVKKLRLVMTRDQYATYKGEQLLFAGPYKLRPSKSPAEIDVFSTEGESKDKPAQGIYSLEGDTLKLCYTMPGKERPKDFESKAGSEASFIVWKRTKP
jgi:uncharacterized protein (TIGR03067 family)